MNVRVLNIADVGNEVPGPPDLNQYGEGDRIYLTGEVSPIEKTRWAAAIGMFVMRGGKVG